MTHALIRQPGTMLVLIADDYPDTAQTLGELLEMSCVVPVTTQIGYDGVQAVAMALARPPAVAILDIDMPVMSGIEAATAIRAELDPCPLLIAITGNPLRDAAAVEVFDHLLVKPVDLDQLVALVCSV